MFLVAGLAVAGLVGIAAAFYFSIRSGSRGDKRLRSAGAGRAGAARRPGRQEQHRQTRPDQTRSERPSPPRPPTAPGRSPPSGLPPSRRGLLAPRPTPDPIPSPTSTRCSRAAGRPLLARRRRAAGVGWPAAAGRAAAEAMPGPRTRGRMTRCPVTRPGTRPGRPSRAVAWASAREPTSMRNCGRRRRSAASATSSSGTTWRRTSRSPRPRVPPSRTRRAGTGYPVLRLALGSPPGPAPDPPLGSTRVRPPTRRPSRPRRPTGNAMTGPWRGQAGVGNRCLSRPADRDRSSGRTDGDTARLRGDAAGPEHEAAGPGGDTARPRRCEQQPADEHQLARRARAGQPREAATPAARDRHPAGRNAPTATSSAEEDPLTSAAFSLRPSGPVDGRSSRRARNADSYETGGSTGSRGGTSPYPYPAPSYDDPSSATQTMSTPPYGAD